MKKVQTRNDLFREYRKEINNNIFFKEIIHSNKYYEKMVFDNFKKFLPTDYEKFMISLKKEQIKLVDPKIINHERPEIAFIYNFFDEKENVLQNNFIDKHVVKYNFSSHSLNKERSYLLNNRGNRKSASRLFHQEFGIEQKEVKKMKFANKTKEQKINIAIDGVAGAGKSTIAKLLAKKLNYLYIDTGLMFRTITYIAQNNKISYEHPKKIIKKFEASKVIFNNDKVQINGLDMSLFVRSPEISKDVSMVSVNPIIREFLKKYQQKLATKKGIIMDGRDIGSVILPLAELKLYIVADSEIRAQRRVEQNTKLGFKTNYEEVLIEIKKRDKIDMERPIAPLIKVEDAIQINSSKLPIEVIVNKIMGIVNDKIKILNL